MQPLLYGASTRRVPADGRRKRKGGGRGVGGEKALIKKTV